MIIDSFQLVIKLALRSLHHAAAALTPARDRDRRTPILVEQFLTHALGLADVCYVLAKGRVRFAGDPSELRAGAAADYLGA